MYPRVRNSTTHLIDPNLSIFFRIRSHCTKNRHSKNRYNFLRHPWYSLNCFVLVKHRRCNGECLSVYLLENLLLRLHKKNWKEEKKKTCKEQSVSIKYFYYGSFINYVDKRGWAGGSQTVNLEVIKWSKQPKLCQHSFWIIPWYNRMGSNIFKSI